MSEPGFSRELNSAIDQLESSLQGALAAIARLRALAPQIAATTDVVREIEAILAAHQPLATPAKPAPPSRPSIVAPGGLSPQPGETLAEQAPAPERPDWIDAIPPPPAIPEVPATPEPRSRAAGTLLGADEPLNTFRLEIQSAPGPLDLRTVDDIVSDHPAVRDVALLDYDGRHATLKVWAITEAQPADIQEWLVARARNVFEGSDDIHITAIEDAA